MEQKLKVYATPEKNPWQNLERRVMTTADGIEMARIKGGYLIKLKDR